MTQKYSLWLTPEGEVYFKLKKLIDKLANQYGGPKFEPHVTLLGDLNLSQEEALSKAFQLSIQLQPYTIGLGALDYTESYFRCVFIKAKKTKQVMRANLEARKIFNIRSNEKYMPHLSLLYGNFDENLKKKIIKELGALNFKLKVKRIYLTNSSRFTEPKEWQAVAEFPFGVIDSLKKGKIGVIPTDTIYGIVGSALNKKTVEEIYRLKKRSKNKPFIILISNLNDLKKFDIKLNKTQIDFLKKIWPNPVSVVLHNLAFRIPKDLWLRRLLEKVGPLIAPSANFEGEKVSEIVKQARKYFGDKVSFYIDGGKIQSKASTIIELDQDGKFKVLRQGTYKV